MLLLEKMEEYFKFHSFQLPSKFYKLKEFIIFYMYSTDRNENWVWATRRIYV